MTSLGEKIIKLRRQGKTYGEIPKILNTKIAKSTLSYWCHNIKLTNNQKEIIHKFILNNIEKGRKKAIEVNREKREAYLKSIRARNNHLKNILKSKDISKVALSLLYLGEGSKTKKGSLAFGNSDPFIIDLFLNLLRKCYSIDEKKFRCTVQCRADQDIQKLEVFWSNVTKISPKQFYKTRIDSRTIGNPSKKLDYKGVCRIDYFSGEIFIELSQIPRIIYKYGLVA